MALGNSLDVPYRDKVVGATAHLSEVWARFFDALYTRLYPLGAERIAQLENNQSVAADVTGLRVDARAVSQAIVEYCVQRVTTGDDAIELIESGSFYLTYAPTAEEWTLSVAHEDLPDDAEIVFSVTAEGQVQYTTSEIAGDPSLSRMIFRTRTLAGKSAQYSSQGAR